MIKIIENFFDRLQQTPMSFGLWISSFLGIVILRDFFESILSFQSVSSATSFHLVHFPLFFLSLFLAVIVLLHFFSRVDAVSIARMGIFFFGIILFPILVDFLIQCVYSQNVLYVYVEKDLGWHFTHFFLLTTIDPNIPYGIRLEIISIVLFSFCYISIKRKSFLWALWGSFCIYVACFIAIALPALIEIVHHAVAARLPFVNLGNTGTLLNSADHDTGLRLVSIVQLLCITVLAGVWYWRYDQRKCRALLSNMRATRCLHYILLMVFGMILHYCVDPERITANLSILRFLGAAFALFFAFQFSVVTNDAVDISTDQVSNQDRPLVRDVLSVKEYLEVGFVYLALSLLFGLQAGDAVFMLILVFIIVYFVYSLPPLRLKRFLGISNAVIGLEALVAVFVGYVFRQDSPVSLNNPSPEIFWGIFFIFFLASSVKDLKDMAGDRSAGVLTLPILVGSAKANQTVAVLVLTSYFLLPFSLYRSLDPIVFFLVLSSAALLGGFSYLRMRSGKLKEDMIFAVYFIYLVVVSVALLVQSDIVQARIHIGF